MLQQCVKCLGWYGFDAPRAEFIYCQCVERIDVTLKQKKDKELKGKTNEI